MTNGTGHPETQIENVIINAVIDELVYLTGWDPIAIYPDHRPGIELGMSDSTIASMARNLSKRLCPNSPIDPLGWKDLSLRQIVSALRASCGSPSIKVKP